MPCLQFTPYAYSCTKFVLGFNYKRQRFFQVAACLSKSAPLCIYSGDFLDVSNVPATMFFDDRCNLSSHRGMLPCFFLGLVSRLFSRARRAVMMRARVSAGSVTASMYPRSAATNGLAKRSRDSAIFSWRRLSRSGSSALHGGVDIENSCEKGRLIADDADGAAIEARETYDEILGVVFVHFKKVTVIHDSVDGIFDVIRLLWVRRNQGVKQFIAATRGV